MSGGRVQTTFWPRDIVDLALSVTLGATLSVAFVLLPAVGVAALLRQLGVNRLCTGELVLFTYWAIAAGLISASVFRVTYDQHGLRFVRLAGSPRLIRWDDMAEVGPAPRSEVFLKGWLWPLWPPREATWSMTLLGHVRIVHVGGVTYLPPRDLPGFLSLMRSHGIAVSGN
jgi:hypothetical protein